MYIPGFRKALAAGLSALTAPAMALIMTGGTATAQAATTTAISSCTATVNGPAVTMKIKTPGKSAKCTFHGSVGQHIAVVITNPVTSDDNGETLTLLDPSGAPIASTPGCCNGSPVGIGPVDLTVSGTYTVRLNLDSTATGSARLWVSAPITAGTAAVNGPSAAMKVTRVGQGVQRTFSGKAGQHVAVVVTNPVTSDDNGETLTLLDPSGAPIASTPGCCNGSPVGIGPVDLTVSGTYTVRFEPRTTATGSATLWVSAPITAGTAAVNGPSAAMNATRVGQGVQRTFSGKAGQHVAAVITNPVTSDDNGETLTLLDPSGAPIASTPGCCNGSPVGIGPVDLTVSGTYTVRFEPGTTATGSATLWVSAPITVGTVTINGSAKPMDVSRVGQGVQRTFSGKAGQHITMIISNPVTSDDNGETLTLLDPSGAPIASTPGCCNGSPVSLGPVTLPTSGTYKVRFEANVTATGSGSLRVST